MKVYVVTCGIHYEDSYVIGVTKTRKKAVEIVEKDKEKDEMDWYDITAYEVEE